ncbi:MAG: DegT/DnrJ/EryC1/StrS family aminotransferase [Polynucleobacter sp.]|uniref:DegT/DnrJ/EryC1/StrS family aminotransferase n=1 Tax=Polynucleobacter sp. TaxID=2029855 RepID=UPI002724C3B3|nr:DegT/DnrJ/EryC1/StrS family aminotransferase [Polynucleobacter sp.]MDO8713801.1 DegT/DnrJ/EryC1/StrS family aminotransferase [Polynucleobacter sp.]
MMIPVSKPYIAEQELAHVSEAVRSGWVSSLGPYIDAFESRFADYCGTKYAVTVSNGTVGLHLALIALGVKPGDEVIVPDLTFVATANAVVTAQATPVMVDVRRDTYCIDPDQIVRAITPRTKAIIPVHLYGHPANMSAILSIAKSRNLLVIEDAAEAHGASIDGTRVGAFGDCGVFSFYGNKIITSGEGGMITTNSDETYRRIKHLRDHAMSKDVRYWHTEVGYNYRMTNMQAALGLSQLNQIESFLDKRSRILEKYRKYLAPEGVECNPSIDASCVNWMVCAVVNSLGRSKRDLVIDKMREQGVDARPFFFPVSALPMFAKADNPVSMELSENGFNLPTYFELELEKIGMICTVFLRSLDEVR